jgi:hypothetical protein
MNGGTVLRRRRRQRFARIGCRREDAFFQFQIAFGDFVLLVFEQLLQFFHVTLDGFGLRVVLVGNQVGIRQPHDRGSSGLRQRAAVRKIGIDKLGVPGKSS